MATLEQAIRAYFPESEWDRALCIATHECSPSRERWPESCVGYEGYIDCSGRPTSDPRYSFGPFQIFESCWDPGRNASSPFTPEHWAKVLDINVNTWMASVIWSRSGWRAWSTCVYCEACDIQGGAIPHPEGPIALEPPPPPPPVGSIAGVFLVGIMMLIGGLVLTRQGRR